MNPLERMSPERRRQVLIVTAAGGILVVFLLARRRQGADAQLVPTMPSAAELGIERTGGGFDWTGTPVDEETPRLMRTLIASIGDLTAKVTAAATAPAPAAAPATLAASAPAVAAAPAPAPTTFVVTPIVDEPEPPPPPPPQPPHDPYWRDPLVFDVPSRTAFLTTRDEDAVLVAKALGRPVAY